MIAFLQFFVMFVIPAFRRSLVNVLWRKPTGNLLPTSIVASAVPGAALDVCHSKSELLVQNALLRQQLIVLRRQVSRPHLTKTDRAPLMLLAGRLRTWRNALLIVQPDTLLRWHREGFRLFWRRKSKTASRKPRLSAETVGLIKRMALENRLWGAERISGELLKLDIRVGKRTVQKYMHQAHGPGPTERKANQNWCTFVHNHAPQVWACGFLPVYDLFFRPLFLFFIFELGSRRVVHFSVTRSPTDEWTAQQLREATPFGQTSRFLIRDNDSKYAERFKRVVAGSGIEVLRTPYKAPRANASCERFVGSVRRECTDHILILSEKRLYRVIKEYMAYYNRARPHQGIGQRIPEAARTPVEEGTTSADQADRAETKVISFPVLGGLHHDYRRVA
ncbi:MAG: integrase core domain-containing protein [Chloroflexota bacterium]